MICLALAVGAGYAQNRNGLESPDTIMSAQNARSVTLIHDGSGVRVTVDGSDGNAELHSTVTVDTDRDVTMRSGQLAGYIPFVSHRCRDCQSNWSAVMGGLGFGFVNALGGEAGRYVEMGKSFEISVLNLIGASYSVPACMANVTVGFGIDWKNYRITTPDMRFAMTSGCVSMEEYPGGVTPKNSRLKTFSLDLPVYWQQQFPVNVMGGDRFSVTLGVVLSYVTHASLRSSWIDQSGKKVTDRANDIGHRRFKADLLGIVRIASNVGIYVRYSPSTVLTDPQAPQFRSFSTGVIIGY